MLTCPVLM